MKPNYLHALLLVLYLRSGILLRVTVCQLRLKILLCPKVTYLGSLCSVVRVACVVATWRRIQQHFWRFSVSPTAAISGAHRRHTWHCRRLVVSVSTTPSVMRSSAPSSVP